MGAGITVPALWKQTLGPGGVVACGFVALRTGRLVSMFDGSRFLVSELYA